MEKLPNSTDEETPEWKRKKNISQVIQKVNRICVVWARFFFFCLLFFLTQELLVQLPRSFSPFNLTPKQNNEPQGKKKEIKSLLKISRNKHNTYEAAPFQWFVDGFNTQPTDWVGSRPFLCFGLWATFLVFLLRSPHHKTSFCVDVWPHACRTAFPHPAALRRLCTKACSCTCFCLVRRRSWALFGVLFTNSMGRLNLVNNFSLTPSTTKTHLFSHKQIFKGYHRTNYCFSQDEELKHWYPLRRGCSHDKRYKLTRGGKISHNNSFQGGFQL